VAGPGARGVRGGPGAKRAALDTREPPRGLPADAAESHQFIADMQHHAVLLEEPRHGGEARGGFPHRDLSGVRAERLGEREGAEGIQPPVRHGRHIAGMLVYEERVSVKDGADARRVEPGHYALPAGPAVRPFLAVQLHAAETKEAAAAVIVNLGEPKAAGHLDPIGHVGLGERAEVEQVRAVIEGDFARPRPGGAADRQLAGARKGRLKRRQQLRHRRGHDGHARADQPELLLARGVQFALQRRQSGHPGEQVQRMRAGAERLGGRSRESERDIQKDQGVNIPATDRLDAQDNAVRARFSLEHRLKAIGAEAQGQPPAGQRGGSGGKLPPLNPHPRTRRSAGCAEVIRPRGAVHKGHVPPFGRNGVVEPRILQNQGRRVPGEGGRRENRKAKNEGSYSHSAHGRQHDARQRDRQAGAGVFNAQMLVRRGGRPTGALTAATVMTPGHDPPPSRYPRSPRALQAAGPPTISRRRLPGAGASSR